MAIALSIAQNEALVKNILDNNISQDYYKELILNIKQNTHYNNLWIQVLDKDLNSVYRSWTGARDSGHKEARKDLHEVLKAKKPLNSISSGLYTLSLKAMVPLYKNNEAVGIVEVISHFNSISKELQNFGINSVVVLKKEQSDELLEPFTNMFVGDHYIANFNASEVLLQYLKKNGVQNYFTQGYKLHENHLITTYKLQDIKDKTIAYFIMFKDVQSVSHSNINFFMFKVFAISVLALLFAATVIMGVISFKNRRDKKHYKNIIDSSSNIVVVTTREVLIQVNRAFFKYFKEYKTLEEFQEKHASIADLFAAEQGYIYKSVDGLSWIDYLIQNPNENKVKIVYGEREYYFRVSVSLMCNDVERYSVIFSDITKEELYKKELEQTNITDALTKIKNRYYYNIQIKRECANANRYFYPLSLVIFDVDYFKKVNDVYGHDVGDRVLVEYATLISEHLRESDVFCRIGGEEFALILPHTTKAGAYKIADKLRIIVQEHKEVLPITMSFGVVEYKKGEDLDFLFKRADEALYEAKHSGRNRVVVR
ncbi:MAG: hypothetical protein QG559_417 [Campylobacterota bacterium]|nr:hypothetical protein [Campylobacterota bacterium]